MQPDGQGGLTLSRRVPARFDLQVVAAFPAMDPLRLAHQLRQDIWRALRDLRGFAPAIRIERQQDALRVTAGGSVDGPVPLASAERKIHAVLTDPAHRLRWRGFANGDRYV